jgi:hypothetical protein
MWIGIDDRGCCHEKILSGMWIGKDVRGIFHDQFEVPCGFEQMRKG